MKKANHIAKCSKKLYFDFKKIDSSLNRIHSAFVSGKSFKKKMLTDIYKILVATDRSLLRKKPEVDKLYTSSLRKDNSVAQTTENIEDLFALRGKISILKNMIKASLDESQLDNFDVNEIDDKGIVTYNIGAPEYPVPVDDGDDYPSMDIYSTDKEFHLGEEEGEEDIMGEEYVMDEEYEMDDIDVAALVDGLPGDNSDPTEGSPDLPLNDPPADVELRDQFAKKTSKKKIKSESQGDIANPSIPKQEDIEEMISRPADKDVNIDAPALPVEDDPAPVELKNQFAKNKKANSEVPEGDEVLDETGGVDVVDEIPSDEDIEDSIIESSEYEDDESTPFPEVENDEDLNEIVFSEFMPKYSVEDDELEYDDSLDKVGNSYNVSLNKKKTKLKASVARKNDLGSGNTLSTIINSDFFKTI